MKKKIKKIEKMILKERKYWIQQLRSTDSSLLQEKIKDFIDLLEEILFQLDYEK